MIKNGKTNEVQNIDIPGGVKGAFWTLTAAQLASLLQNGGLGSLLGNLTGGGGGNIGAMLPMIAQMVANGTACHGATDKERAELLAKIAELQAEKYSDTAAKAETDRLIAAYINPMATEIADARVREARMQEEIKCIQKTQDLREEILKKDIELAKQEAKCCCEKNAAAIANVAATVAAITTTKIAASALPTTTTTTTTP